MDEADKIMASDGFGPGQFDPSQFGPVPADLPPAFPGQPEHPVQDAPPPEFQPEHRPQDAPPPGFAPPGFAPPPGGYPGAQPGDYPGRLGYQDPAQFQASPGQFGYQNPTGRPIIFGGSRGSGSGFNRFLYRLPGQTSGRNRISRRSRFYRPFWYIRTAIWVGAILFYLWDIFIKHG